MVTKLILLFPPYLLGEALRSWQTKQEYVPSKTGIRVQMDKYQGVTETDTIYIPTPFLICPNEVLTTAIRNVVTAPPSPDRLPWRMLPELDAQAIASNKRLEQLRQERERQRAEAERQASLNQSGRFGQPNANRLSGGFDFSSGNSQGSLGSSASSEESSDTSTGSGFTFSVQSSGHRRKASTETAPKRHRASITANFSGGSLNMDVFNHEK